MFTLAILLIIGGSFFSALYTFVLGIAGAPGAILTHATMRRQGTHLIPTWGLLLTLLGQVYASLAWVAAIVLFVRSSTAAHSGLGVWIVWFAAFLIAIGPASFALKEAASVHREKPQAFTVQHGAAAFTELLTVIGFFVFAFAPNMIEIAWSWVPQL